MLMRPVINLDGLRFVPVADVARHFNVLSTTMLRELQRARVSVIYIGAQAQVNVAELEQWLQRKHNEAQKESTGGVQ